MKGEVVSGMIAVMVGAILIFTVIAPITNNAILGTEYLNETMTNATEGATYTILHADCAPLRSDTTYVSALNTSGITKTSVITVYNATEGQFKYTNATTLQEDDIMISYRCLDSAYVDDNTGRTIATIILPLVLVFLIIGLTGFLM